MSERASHDREEEWIEKYRAALQGAPRERSRLDGVRRAARKVRNQIFDFSSKLFGDLRHVKSHSQDADEKQETGLKKTSKQPGVGTSRSTKAG